MKCSARIFLFFLILLLPAAAFAADRIDSAKGPYIGIRGGVVFMPDEDMGFLKDTEFDLGYGAAMSLGYDFGYEYGRSRLEAELGYRTNGLDKTTFFGDSRSADGDAISVSLMGNGYYVFENPSIVQPYLMGGIGAAFVSVDGAEIEGVTAIDDDSVEFAYQAGIGVSFDFNRNFSMDLDYRYFATTDTELEDEAGETLDFDYRTHNVFVGFRYNF